jgi:hypothetical protein
MKQSRWLGAGLFCLAVGLAATALLGPLGVGVIHQRVSGLMLSQLKGVDVDSLLLVAPLCVVIGLLAMHGRRAAPVLATPPYTATCRCVTSRRGAPRWPVSTSRIYPRWPPDEDF